MNAKEFATGFIDRRFADVADMLTDDGQTAIIDCSPDFLTTEGMDPEEVLEQYWWGLHGQYGGPGGVGGLILHNTEATITVAFEKGGDIG